MGRAKSTGVIRCANAGCVMEKTLASELADAFSKHLPACQAKHNPVFSPNNFFVSRKAGHFAEQNERWGFSNPVEAR